MNKEIIISTLLEKRLINSKKVDFIPITGGVSSEIYLVTDGFNKYVVKQARSRLQVEDDWHADPSRSEIEQEFIFYLQKLFPDAVPEFIFRDTGHRFFVMEYLDQSFKNWKEQLLEGKFKPEYAEKAAELLAGIHFHSWNNEELKKKFDDIDNFYSLRIEPYLVTTGNRHPDLKNKFHQEADRLRYCRKALVHGDFSPKNIMVKSDRVVLLDHEVAWFGDPAFDVAFLLNHLYLKMLFHSSSADQLPDLSQVAWKTYFENLSAKKKEGMELRIGRLLLMLMLARVDGKSPVEYFQDTQKDFVRSFVYDLLSKEVYEQAAINSKWKSKLMLQFLS